MHRCLPRRDTAEYRQSRDAPAARAVVVLAGCTTPPAHRAPRAIAGLGAAVTVGPSQLGPVITRIRCSLTARDDHRHTGIPVVDGSALSYRSALWYSRSVATRRAVDWPQTGAAGFACTSLNVTCAATPRRFAAACRRRRGELQAVLVAVSDPETLAR